MSATVIDEIIGQTMIRVERIGERIEMESADALFTFEHYQDCCETVGIVDICGDLSDLVGSPIVECEVVTDTSTPPGDYAESWTWTFHKFRTARGSVTVRWLGKSNGYYGEEVSIHMAVRGDNGEWRRGYGRKQLY